MNLKKYKHAPAHLFLDDHYYFFTGAVYKKRQYLESLQAKDIFKNYLFRFHEKFDWMIKEWSILDNHYHFLSKVAEGNEISRMINTLHKTSAYHIKRSLKIQIEPFWYQYWDRCIRNDEDYHKTAFYILYNPIKHGLVESIEGYPYSSYCERPKEIGEAFGIRLERYERYDKKDFKEFDELDDF